MKIYKDKQYLVFDFEDGRNVKYDFATHTSIGFKGKPVRGLNSQLKGLTINKLLDCCVDKNYANFLKYIYNKHCSCGISNIGTILRKVPEYSNLEQLFSAGFKYIENSRLKIQDIPKSLIKIAKDHEIYLSRDLINCWKENPDAHYIAYQLDYMSLDDRDIMDIFNIGWYNWDNKIYKSYYNILIDKYGYNAKALLMYCDRLKTFEAIDNMGYLLQEINDYARMMSSISDKYDKFPRHFLTTHKIACRNYNRLKKEFPEELFKKRINLDYECKYKDYVFIYPKCVQDIRDEAVNQNNCVASYIDNVINGDCHILFLRKKDSLNDSLVTIEVRNNQIVQAKRKFNYPVTKEDQEAIDYWNKKFENYNNENNKCKNKNKERNVA